MSDQRNNESLLDMFIFETSQFIEQLEQYILNSEKSGLYSEEAINEIFRIMHTIKGASAMMMFSDISKLSHAIEDLFYYLREKKPSVDYSTMSDLVLESVDFIKLEIEKLKDGYETDGDAEGLIEKIKEYVGRIDQGGKQCDNNYFKAVIYFEDGCEMENIRAFSVVRDLEGITRELNYTPRDILDSDDSAEIIRRDGFKISFKTDRSYEEINKLLSATVFLKDFELTLVQDDVEVDNNIENYIEEKASDDLPSQNSGKSAQAASKQQSIISVSVNKLDKLMDLVGEMVISEAMVVQNPDLEGLELNSFHKAARQLHKITSEMQDIVMSIRMVPLSATFLKMHRIVRDMCKKLGKEVELKVVGEETEVDKNVIEHISDPLMHLVRNALDHGIESPEERQAKGKPGIGTITLEAKNSGSDVLIIVKDDGKGLDKSKILEKAREKGLIYKPEEDMSDKEIFNLILLPGFSTNENVTEFSGRGVGMDVVVKNIETIGGSTTVDSILDKGSAITLKIPLTLAIIDGTNIKVGSSCYTIPTISIRESFRPKESDIFSDPDGNEMIMVRGLCYPILRLHELFNVKNCITSFTDGIITIVEQDEKTICIFSDEVLGQQQVVVKTLPTYIRRFKRTNGLSGCTLLGDGSISLILDITGLIGSVGLSEKEREMRR